MRLIDADRLGVILASHKGHDKDSFIAGMSAVIDVIDSAPTVDAEPVRHGHWNVREQFSEYEAWYQCSECDAYDLRETSARSPYCWACGARMDEGESDAADRC